MKVNPWKYFRFIVGCGLLSALMSITNWGAFLVVNAQPVTGDTPREPAPSVGPVAGQTYALVVQNTHAYIGVGLRLRVLDVSMATEPVVVGETMDLPDFIKALQVVDEHAYLATGEAGLLIVNVADPSAPRQVGEHDTQGHASGVYVAGELAYVADGAAGTHVIDVSNPSNPVLVGTSPTGGWDWDVFVVDGIAYIAAEEEGLRVVDVADPARPRQISSFLTSGGAMGVFVEEGFAYVAAGSSGLWILDVTRPANPVAVGVNKTEYARNVRVKEGFAYVATERKGILVIDVQNPARFRRLRRFAPNRSANMIDIEGDNLFVADGAGGLLAVSLSRSRAEERSRRFIPLQRRSR